MSVTELIGLLQHQDPDSTVYVYDEYDQSTTTTAEVQCVLSVGREPHPYVIISQDGPT